MYRSTIITWCKFTLFILTTQMNISTLFNITTNTYNLTSAQYYHEASNVIINTDQITYNLLNQAVLAYGLIEPTANITVLQDTPSNIIDNVKLNQVDLGFYAGSFDATTATSYPDMTGFPIISTGIAPVYNLPDAPAGFVLALRSITMGKIYLGEINQWNDPLVLADNPTATWLPSTYITLVLRTTEAGTNNIFSRAINDVYPTFGETLGVGFSQNYSNVTYNTNQQIIQVESFNANVAEVMLHPYSFTVATAEAANQLLYPTGYMINNQDHTVQLLSGTVFVSAVEQGTASSMTQYSDFSNAMSPFAYPIAGAVSLIYNIQQTRTTCAAKEQAVAFILWFQSSATVTALTTTVSLIPNSILAVSGFIMQTPECNGNALSTSTNTDTGSIAGTDALGRFTNNVLAFYQSINTQRIYQFQSTDQFTALDQLMNGEIDIAFVEPDYLNYTDLNRWTTLIDSNDLTVLPVALEYAVPGFNLPQIITNLTDPTIFNTTLYGETTGAGYYGIAMDLPTLSNIWTGNINDWTDPAISTYSPWLGERIQYLQQQNASITIPITLMICCSDATTPTPALQVVAYGMEASIRPGTWFEGADFTPIYTDDTIPSNYHTWTMPFSFHTNLTNLGKHINYVMLDNELAMQTTIAQYDGAIGYYMATQDGFDPTTQMVTVFPPPPGSPPDVYVLQDYYYNLGDVDGALACIIPQSSPDINRFSVQMDSIAQSPYCWVFTQMVSAAVLSHYDDNNGFPIATADANITLNMLEWLTNNTLLHRTARNSGLGMISELPDYNAEVIHALTYIQCNGANCLITLPTYWSLSTPVSSFGYALGSIMMAVCIVTMCIVYQCRKRVIIRSASVTFLLLILSGLILLYMSSVVLVQTPTIQTCGLFAWFANFGLELIFVPLFLKMYRIYKIFSRKQLKIVKMSDVRLLSYGSVLLVFDVIMMSVWQGTAPLQPITTHVYSGVHDTQYLQCNIPNNNATYVLILGIEKACLLLFGCVMSFSTRKVSGSFNESTSVAWSIYNTILATAVLIPIIAFVNALGDTLIVLILIMILWIGVSIYAFLFGTKLYTLALGEAQEQVSQLESNRILTGGFSFVSIDALSKQTITQYMTALKQHMHAVEIRAKQLMQYSNDTNSRTSKSRADSTAGSVNHKYAPTQDHTGAVHVHKKSNSFAHETIAPIRRDTPSFVPSGALGNTSVLNAIKLNRNNSSVTATPIFPNRSASAPFMNQKTNETGNGNDVSDE